MALAEVLATGSTAATSSEVTIGAGEDVVFALKDVTGPHARVYIEVKDDAGNWQPTSANEGLSSITPVWALRGTPSTVRFRRVAGATCGVFRAA